MAAQPAPNSNFAKPATTPTSRCSSVIGNRDERGLKKPFGPKSKVAQDPIEDLPGGRTFVSDPNTLKVREWIEGKERNIRALLCSLHTVLWDDEGRWKEIGMHQLVYPDQVRRYYRKAILSVHPDRLAGHPHKELGRLIFIELNDAWWEYEGTELKSPHS